MRSPGSILALIARCVEWAHEPAPEVSLFHLAVQIRSAYGGMLIALPPDQWSAATDSDIPGTIARRLQLARHIKPKSLATSHRGPKTKMPKGYVDGSTARAHVATARVMAKAKLGP